MERVGLSDNQKIEFGQAIAICSMCGWTNKVSVRIGKLADFDRNENLMKSLKDQFAIHNEMTHRREATVGFTSLT